MGDDGNIILMADAVPGGEILIHALLLPLAKNQD